MKKRTRRTIAMSDESGDDDNNGSNKTGKLKDPLDLSGSNWLVVPADNIPTYLLSSDSDTDLNGLNILNGIKYYKLSTVVPGNALIILEV